MAFASTTGVVGSAGLNLAIQLLIPTLLGPSGYSELVISLAAAQLAVGILFEWLRFSILRFCTESQLHSEDEVTRGARASLMFVYWSLLGLTLTAFVCLWPFDRRSALVILYIFSQAFFDCILAGVRAWGNLVAFAIVSILRPAIALVVIGFISILGGDFTSGEAFFIFASSFLIAGAIGVFMGGPMMYLPGRPDWKALVQFLKFGGLASGVGISANASLVALRLYCQTVFSSNVATLAGVLFSIEIFSRVSGVIGAAVNVIAVKHLFHSRIIEDDTTIRKVAQRQMLVLMMGFGLSSSLLAIVSGSTYWFANVSYLQVQLNLISAAPMVLPALSFLTLRQYAVDTSLLAGRSPSYACFTAAFSMVLMFACIPLSSIEVGWISADLHPMLASFAALSGLSVSIIVSTKFSIGKVGGAFKFGLAVYSAIIFFTPLHVWLDSTYMVIYAGLLGVFLSLACVTALGRST